MGLPFCADPTPLNRAESFRALSKEMTMAKKPNYDFERRERQRLQAEKKALRVAAKKEAREAKSKQSETFGPETAKPPFPER
ncbi:MAG: hypothetical protein H8E36_00385 [Rhodospirillaceae bacterium]|nr:hypothetical protein [Rhodospirillaceae bacterium]MBL6941230.1 hypothetical protein [Rhodospirillales bacterium]